MEEMTMKEALKKLNKEQIKFICSECSVSEEELNSMDEDKVYDVVYEKMCDIEIEEVCANDSDEDTERCEIASDIVTILGNALAKKEGFFDSQEDEE